MDVFCSWGLLLDYQRSRGQVWEAARISRREYSIAWLMHGFDVCKELENVSRFPTNWKYGRGTL